MKLSDLIKKADGLREDAFLNRGLISRRNPDNTLLNISFDVKQVVDGINGPLLQKEDQVLIRSVFSMQRAGGLLPGAFVKGASLIRTYKLSVAELEKKKIIQQKDTTMKDSTLTDTKQISVGIELDKILASPGGSNDLMLQTGTRFSSPVNSKPSRFRAMSEIPWHSPTKNG